MNFPPTLANAPVGQAVLSAGGTQGLDARQASGNPGWVPGRLPKGGGGEGPEPQTGEQLGP